MAAGKRVDPYRNYRFLVEIQGIVQGGFSEATIPDVSQDPIEYREGIDAPTVRKLSGLIKYGNLTLKWGITDSMEFSKWRKLVEEGKLEAARRDIAVILMNNEGKPASRWEFTQAWPFKYDAPDMNAKGTDVAMETLEIAHEGMERVS